MIYRPLASDDLVEGYREAAELAKERAAVCRALKDGKAADPWERLAVYCEQMANTRALDDDQWQFQRNAMKHRREQPMSAEEMDTYGLFVIGTDNPGLQEWQWAAIELAMGYLSPLQRVCFEMVVAGRLTHKEVAEALNMSVLDVRKHINRARATFEKRVQPRLKEVFDHKPGRRTNLST